MALVLDTQEEEARSFSQLYSAKKVCELALGKINAFSVNDSAADPVHLSRALNWLDMIVAEIAGTNRCFWLVHHAAEVALDADVSSYALADALGSNLPRGGVQFVIGATVTDANGNDEPVELIDVLEYDSIEDKATSGSPTKVYVDRLQHQTIKPYPIPGDNTLTLKLNIVSYAPNMNRNNGEAAHGLTAAWQLWMVNALAAEIGDGPIRRLNANTINGMRQHVGLLRNRLLTFNNQANPGTGQPARTRAWGA